MKHIFSPANQMGLFEGKSGNIWPHHNMTALRSRSFYTSGKILAHATLQCGIGFSYFSPALFALMSGSSDEEVVAMMSLDDVNEGDEKETITGVIN